jgi:hypothetical protein
MPNALLHALNLGTAATALALFGCASSAAPSGPLDLHTNWIFTSSDGYSATALDIAKDNSYTVARIAQTTPSTFDLQEEKGTLAVSGGALTFTPASSTCRYASDPPYTAEYQIDGDSLTVWFSWGVVQLKQNTASGSSASGLILTNGCFQKNGGFVPTPLTPIGACSDAGVSCASAPCCLGNTCDKSGICAAVCTSNAGCKSGCCPLAPTSEGLRGCGPASSCP